MNRLTYNCTDSSITVFHEGKTYTVAEGSPNFLLLRDALKACDWEEALKHVTVRSSLVAWAKGRVTVDEAMGQFLLDFEAIPDELNKRMVRMATDGQSPGPYLKFWQKLKDNPSMRSVGQLWGFLSHQNLPVVADGDFLAYKSVNSNYTDVFTGKVVNTVGSIHEMPRNKISDDPREACRFGFHVGALGYVDGYGPSDKRIIICKVNPRDVVCVPYDEREQKMRVCRYVVVGHMGDELPSNYLDLELPEAETETDCSVGEPLAAPVQEPSDEHHDSTKVRRTHKVPRKYLKYMSLSSGQLMDLSLDELRTFATHGLAIIGASKIHGGKTALVVRINEVRG